MIPVILQNLIKWPSIALLRTFDFLVGRFADNKDVWPAETFPFTDFLTKNTSIFLVEYDQLVQSRGLQNVKDFFIVETDINSDDKWKAAPLFLFNHLFMENAARCPETMTILSQIPGCCGAMYSVLGPGKYIPPHKGIYKGIYRCLLTLRLEPGADCWIRVNDNKLYFKEGECIVFDETEEHEVKNASNYPRVVLFLDIQRKLPFTLDALNSLIYGLLRISPFVKNILQQHAALEKTSFKDHHPISPQLK